MVIKRREFLLFLGASAGTAAIGCFPATDQPVSPPVPTPPPTPESAATAISKLNFQPIRYPLPLGFEPLSSEEQQQQYSRFEVIDDLVLPDGYTYDIIAAWGDRVGDSRCGYNNDYISFVPNGENEGWLTVNFEYISGRTWMQTYSEVIGKSLPFIEVIAAAAASKGAIDVSALPESDPLKAQIAAIAKETYIDQGMGIIGIKRNAEGRWERSYSPADRRITGISGLDDDRYLQATGPAVTVFAKEQKLGYDDGLSDRIIGTNQNCSGGTTPWGTAISAEENYQSQVYEPVKADGSSFYPGQFPFFASEGGFGGCGNVFGLAANKYGWLVEVDPSNPEDYGTKHTWLGRFRHEAVAVRAIAGQPLAVYSGCDRRGGHLYKFTSAGTVTDVKDKQNSNLFADGMLYGAKFNPDGTGRWIRLSPETAIDPVLPSQVVGRDGVGVVQLPNPDREQGGIFNATKDGEIEGFKSLYRTLGDLYQGDDLIQKQGAILIDAHFAANAVGVTCTARPEDTDLADDGTLYVSFTSGSPGSEGGPDKEIFRGPNGEVPYEFGWILRLNEDDNDPGAMSFRWEMLALGGEPADGGLGFSSPDNLEIDRQGNVWMVTDVSTSLNNIALPTREGVEPHLLLGIFGNNSLWFIPTSGDNAGSAYPFAIGAMETECTGPCFSDDEKTLFLSLQHPGERNGKRQQMASETRKFALKTTDGQNFVQERTVPLGSNWPGKGENDPPRPAIVAIRRTDGGEIPPTLA